MVKLDPSSPHDPKHFPYLNKWDVEFRRNYSNYQNQIDKITYQLQRSQRGFAFLGSWFYPYFHQRDFLSLELYKKKQLLGMVFPEEVKAYSKFDPTIAQSLNKTFAA